MQNKRWSQRQTPPVLLSNCNISQIPECFTCGTSAGRRRLYAAPPPPPRHAATPETAEGRGPAAPLEPTSLVPRIPHGGAHQAAILLPAAAEPSPPSPRGGAATSRARIGGARPPRPLTRPRRARPEPGSGPANGTPRGRTKGLLCGRPPARRGADPEPAPPPRAHGGTRGPERGPHPRCAASRRMRRAGSGEDTAPARRAHAAAREGGAGRGGGVHGRTAGPEAGQPRDAAPLRGFNCIYAEGELPVLEPRCTAPWPAEISPLGKVRAESRWPREAFPKRLSPDREQLRDFPLNQHFPFKTEEQLLESSQPPLIAARSLNTPGLWAAR